MKKVMTFILTIICMLTSCRTNKNIPERLLHFELNGEEINLIHIERIDYFGEEVICFVIARGEWAKWCKDFTKDKDRSIFVEETYSLRFARDNDRFKLEKTNGDVTPSWGEPPRLEWENVGYSTDNTLWAKIVEYYLKNKDTLQ